LTIKQHKKYLRAIRHWKYIHKQSNYTSSKSKLSTQQMKLIQF